MKVGHAVRSAGIIGACTLVSRFLGLLRDMALAAFFGTSWVLDAFLLAFTIPNLFRQFFGEGAVTSAFLPVFTEVNEHEGKKRAWQVASSTLTLLTVILFVITIVLMAVAWTLSYWPGITAKNCLALRLTVALLPYLGFICIVALLGAILNALHHFFIPAISPILLNIFWLLGIYFVSPWLGPTQKDAAYGMTAAILVAGVFQVLLQYPALKRQHAELRPLWNLHDPAMVKIFRNIGPVLISAAAIEINVMANQAMAWFLIPGDGAITVLYMANRLMQFPLAVIGSSIATVVLPILSTMQAKGQVEEFRKSVPEALRVSFWVALPASVGLMLLAHPIIQLIYQRQQFDAQAGLRTASVLVAYVSGLWLYILISIILRGYYATGNTRTPMYVSLGAMVTNLLFNFILVQFWHETGLAVGTSLNAALQFSILVTILHRKQNLIWTGTLQRVLHTVLATAFMAVIVLLTKWGVSSYESLLIRVFVPVAAGMLSFFLACYALHVPEMGYLQRKFLRASKQSPASAQDSNQEPTHEK